MFDPVIGGENRSLSERGRRTREVSFRGVCNVNAVLTWHQVRLHIPRPLQAEERAKLGPLTRLRAHRGHGRALALGRTSHATRRICGRPDLTLKNEVRDIGFRRDGSLSTCV
jgi:hypothetical protein